MSALDTFKLSSIIDKSFENDVSIAIRDLFACGCYLHMIGERESGRKTCHAALYAVGFGEHRAFFSALLETIDGNEKQYALNVRPHAEIIKLFES